MSTVVLTELLLLLLVVVVGVVVAVVGWDRYRPRRSPSASAHPTGEAFIDPETGRRLRVWYDPATGAREYREDPPPPAAR